MQEEVSYQIKDTFVNFWFKFVYPNLSNLSLSPEEFYDTYIEKELDAYLERLFRRSAISYIKSDGITGYTCVLIIYGFEGTGRIDIVAQGTRMKNIAPCNWLIMISRLNSVKNMAIAVDRARNYI